MPEKTIGEALVDAIDAAQQGRSTDDDARAAMELWRVIHRHAMAYKGRVKPRKDATLLAVVDLLDKYQKDTE